MITQSLSTFIEREPQVVFGFISDPANLPRWNPTFRSAGWASDAARGVGSRLQASVKVPGGKQVSAEITAWEPPRRWGYVLLTPLFPIRQFETTYTLEPERGGTRVNVVSRTGLAAAVKFLEGLMAKMGDKEVAGNLARLKGLVEAG